MASGPETESDTTKEMKRRIAAARMDRTRRAPLINECLRLSMPHRRRIDETQERTISEEDVSDMLDGTMAETVEDFASDMMAKFTPPSEPWTLLQPSVALPLPAQKQIKEQLKTTVEWFWEDLGQSSFYDAAYECYHDLSAGIMAICRKDYGGAQPVAWEPIQPAALLLDQGPNCSIDGRWYDYTIEKRLWGATYGKIKLPAKYATAKPDCKLKVVDGIHRVWEQQGFSQYRRVVTVDGVIVWEKLLKGEGSVSLHAARWRSDSGSAYGVGPAWKACPAQRVLNEITALTLAQLHKIVDPSVVFSSDGTANIEESGVDAGDWVDLGEGFKAEAMESKGRFDVSFFVQEDMRSQVRRALYQDGPEQKGKTPPTREQWVDERMASEQRFEVPRGKLFREWTIPIVKSHMHLRMEHGLMPPIELDGRQILLAPVSGQAKARAFEKVAKGERVMQSIVTLMPAKADVLIDGAATVDNMKRLLDDDVVVLRDDAQQQELAQLVQAAVAEAMKGMQAAT